MKLCAENLVMEEFNEKANVECVVLVYHCYHLTSHLYHVFILFIQLFINCFSLFFLIERF